MRQILCVFAVKLRVSFRKVRVVEKAPLQRCLRAGNTTTCLLVDIAGTVTIASGATLDFTGSSSLLLTYDAIDGEFDTELNIPQGLNVEYGANELRLIPTGGSVFRFL